MMLIEQFRHVVEQFGTQPPSCAQAATLQHWLRTISMNDVAAEVDAFVNADLRSLVRRLTPNPPAVLDMCDKRGYVLQLLYWYPLNDKSVYGNYDTEDIHSHFGFIATRALIGNPYIATHFHLQEDGRVEKVRESLFQEEPMES